MEISSVASTRNGGVLIPYQFVAGLLDNLLSYVRALRVGLRFPSLRLERNVIIKGRVSNIEIGKRVVIQSGTVVHAGGMAWCEGAGAVVIGDDSTISPNCVLYGAGPGGIRIGRRFDCGPSVGIYASRSDYANHDSNGRMFDAVVIGDDVVVFSHAVIGPGVRIGDRAVIAAGAVVLDDVPEGALVGGVPAKLLRPSVR